MKPLRVTAEQEAREELLERIADTVGIVPADARRMLTLLSHPHVIGYTRRYFQSFEDPFLPTKCLNFPAPWDCIKEAEAHYKNIKFGWTGGAAGLGFDESWCENCRRKIMEE